MSSQNQSVEFFLPKCNGFLYYRPLHCVIQLDKYRYIVNFDSRNRREQCSGNDYVAEDCFDIPVAKVMFSQASVHGGSGSRSLSGGCSLSQGERVGADIQNFTK